MTSPDDGSVGITQYYIPLIRRGQRFVADRQARQEMKDVMRADILGNHVSRTHRKIEGEVEIDGQLYTAIVHIPIHGNDFAYALTDGNLVPVDLRSPVFSDALELHGYFDCLDQLISRSEGVLPEQAVDLRTHFVRPQFLRMLMHGTGKPGEVSWDGLTKAGHVVLLGEPGSGKTTCLRRIALELIDSGRRSGRPASIPIYIQLREFAETGLAVRNLQQLLYRLHAGELAARFDALGRSGRFLLLCDGLDEVPLSHRERVVDSILRLHYQYPRVRVILSSRPLAYEWSFPEFDHLKMQPFTAKQVREWSFQRIYRRKSWKLFITRMTESQELVEMTSNPLLLSVAVSAFLHQSLLPNNLANLVKLFVEMLVEVWDAAREISRYEQNWAAPHRIYPALCKLAFNLSREQMDQFRIEEFQRYRGYSFEESSPDVVLQTLAEVSGLLRQTTGESWMFRYHSFAEFLSAEYLVGSTHSVEGYLQGRLKEENWQAIVSHASALTYDADHLLSLVSRSSEMPSSSTIRLIARMLSQDIEVTEDVLTAGCDRVVSGVEQLIEELSFTLASSGESAELHADDPLWAVVLRHDEPGSVASSPQLRQLKELLRSVYRLRSGPARQMLATRLSNSDMEQLAPIARCLEVEGEFGVGMVQKDGIEYLVATVHPESPEIDIP